MSEVITYEKRGKIKKLLYDNFPESTLVRAEIEDLVNSIVHELTENEKERACAFFRWWWNQGGNNTEQGFDEWLKLEEK